MKLIRWTVMSLGLSVCVLGTAGCDSEVRFAGPSVDKGPDTPPPESGDVVEEPGGGDPPVPAKVRYEQEFPTAQIATASVTMDPDYRRGTEEVTLDEMPPATTTLTQINRLEITDPHVQGHDGTTATPEVFSISSAAKLDVLIVMDDSTSMISEQTNLASKLDPLLSKISNTDWQIGVITMSDPCLQNDRVIKKSDLDAAQAFSDAVLVPLSDTVVEKGFPMAVKALKQECDVWLRPDSQIAVLFVSDEDNCGSDFGEGCPGEEGETLTQFIDVLETVRPVGEARAYGLFEGPGNPCGSAAKEGTVYKQAVEATGGTWGSICQADYTTTLQNISDNVSRIVIREFTLTQTPDSGTLILDVDGNLINTGFEVVGNVVKLTDVGAADMTLTATYVYGATPKFDRFALSMEPDESTIEVTVNSVVVPDNEYTFDDVTGEIVFAAEPIDDGQIQVKYRKNDPLPKEFAFNGSDIYGEPLEVLVDSVATADYVYDPMTQTVTLTDSPRDGMDVAVVHRTLGGIVMDYPTTIDLDQVLSFDIADGDTGDPVPITYANGVMTLPIEEIEKGRVISIGFDLGYEPDDFVFDVAANPLTESFKVTNDQGEAVCEEAYDQSTNTLALDCGNEDVGEVSFSYDYVADSWSTFSVADEIPASATWEIFIDGVATTQFNRQNNVVTIHPDVLGHDSVVKIRISF
jgi:hypothetical protein